MTRLVAQWRESGESQAGFARRHRIPTWTFWYWCQKLTRDRAAPAEASATSAFVPVHVTTDPAAPVVEIVLANGVHIHLRPGASAELVQAAVAALRAAC
jgi:transposase-like protein